MQDMRIMHVVIDCDPTDRAHKVKPIAEVLAQAEDRNALRMAIWCSTWQRAFFGQCLEPK